MIVLWKIEFKPSGVELQPLKVPAAVETFDQLASYLPDGAYTTLRTYRGRYVLRLEDHFQRLAQTADLAGKPLCLDKGALRDALRQVVLYPRGEHATGSDVRLRLTLDLAQKPGMIYVAIEPLEALPEEIYREGVQVVTCHLLRHLPQAKLTAFIERAEPVRQSLPAGVNEAIIVDEQGYLLEGLSSNFFALSNGELFTAGEGVLMGVTRGLALEAVQRLGIPYRLQPVHTTEIPALQEAFITSSSRGLLPVRQIDQVVIGTGQPGEATRKLMQAFDDCVREQLEIL